MRKIIFIAACLTLTACATKYQEMGFSGGVAAQKISNDTYRIVARGNGCTDSITVQDYALLKSAETAKAAGQTHFVILSGADATRQEVGQTPGFAQTNVVGNTAYTTYNPGVTYDIVKPGRDVYVRVFTPTKGEQLPAGAFAADEIIANIGPRVKRST